MMDSYPADLVDAFKSKRLIYRAVENDETDKAFITRLSNDPTTIGMGSPRLVRPWMRSESDKLIEFMQQATLAVMACLPPGGAEPATQDPQRREDDSEADTRGAPQQSVPIGFAVLYTNDGGPSSQHHRSLTVGLVLAREFRGRGYGGEVMNWLLDWGFRRVGVHRIGLTTWSYNERALRLYRRIGFVEEGREREARFFDRQWYDIVHFGILEQEWEKLRGLK
ncbi:hypothetical protein VTK73DRAFT_9724 [Phialemonium thermophilum]|uniref:N-acetyltransferase domain-containing protein n=1 Tax=Phialemonium thermophilum TaxID=223376 RepID=A0ABR3XJS6_9PEZI